MSAVARAALESVGGGGVQAETKRKCEGLFLQLHSIWYASRFGSFDAERRVQDEYFGSVADPRMSFGAAAQHYGMRVLRDRFPDVSEVILRALLCWPLNLLERLLDQLLPPDQVLKALGVR